MEVSSTLIGLGNISSKKIKQNIAKLHCLGPEGITSVLQSYATHVWVHLWGGDIPQQTNVEISIPTANATYNSQGQWFV